MQIFDKNRFLFGFTLSWILGMPATTIAETHLLDSDERKPVIIQLERLPKIAPRDSEEKKPIATQPERLPEIVPRESDEVKSARDRQKESRKNRAKLKNAILLERIGSQKRGWTIKRRDVRGIEGIKNVITIEPKDNWLIIELGEEIIVINPSEPRRLPQILPLAPPKDHKEERRGGAPQNPCTHIPADDLDHASHPCAHIPADDL